MINIKNNVSIKEFTTIHIGCISKCFVDISSVDELKEVMSYIKMNNLRYFVLGNGSNVLVNDKYYDGIVIRINKKFSDIKWLDKSRVEVSSGCLLSTFINECRNKSYSCIERLYGIPGTIGGSIYGNAGANGCSIADFIESVDVLDDGNIRTMKLEECNFGYRDSIFKKEGNLIIISAIFKLKSVNKNFLDSEITGTIRKRRLTQPINKYSCGCIFKNVEKISSWKYIKLLDLKFDEDSNVYISELHSAFIINRGTGTFKDVHNLIESIKNSVYYIYNIRLHEEVEVIDWR